LVVDEAADGDIQAAQKRLQVLQSILILETTPEARELAKKLLIAGALPPKAGADALHVAIAATHTVTYGIVGIWQMQLCDRSLRRHAGQMDMSHRSFARLRN
jgi:hypothetical protein